ncbi:MAG: disulfide bond formation protein B [Betaproteobacteria bacterium]|nr:disulfide bond formation protein B [Betaproteobacteria bacterium]
MPLPFRFAFSRLFASRRLVFALIAIAAAALIAAALIIERIERIFPCSLCVFQRVFYLLILLFAVSGALLPRLRLLWSALIGLSALGGATTALYQSVMQIAPGSFPRCGIGEPNLVERIVDWLAAQWEFMFLAPGLCEDKAWVFLGLSMAMWSALCFAAFFIAAIALIRCGRRG